MGEGPEGHPSLRDDAPQLGDLSGVGDRPGPRCVVPEVEEPEAVRAVVHPEHEGMLDELGRLQVGKPVVAGRDITGEGEQVRWPILDVGNVEVRTTRPLLEISMTVHLPDALPCEGGNSSRWH